MVANAQASDLVPCGLVIEARFVESAPRDRFEIVNRSNSDATLAAATIDLKGSAGKLIFDTADGGTGVEVFQPFRVADGEELLTESNVPQDGAEQVELAFSGFGAGKRFSFTIDVDDRLTSSELGQIRVTGSEISGASLTLSITVADGQVIEHSAAFGDNATALLSGQTCTG